MEVTEKGVLTNKGQKLISNLWKINLDPQLTHPTSI